MRKKISDIYKVERSINIADKIFFNSVSEEGNINNITQNSDEINSLHDIVDEAHNYSEIFDLSNEVDTNKEYERFRKNTIIIGRRRKLRLTSIIASSCAAAVMAISFLLFWEGDNNSLPQDIVAEVSEPYMTIENSNEIVELNMVGNGKELANSKVIGLKREKISLQNTIGRIKISTPLKRTFKVELPDGSIALLDSNSEILYDENFSGDSREVEVKGEVYFDVKKSDKPFVVKCNDTEVRVLGTKFIVSSKVIGATTSLLVSGSVEFSAKGSRVVLKPNQMAKLENKSSEIFKFKDRELRYIIEIVSEWYGVSFNFDSENIKLLDGTLYNFTISRSKDIGAVLNFIELISKECDVSFVKNEKGGYDIYIEM